jgi:hypothetical protein
VAVSSVTKGETDHLIFSQWRIIYEYSNYYRCCGKGRCRRSPWNVDWACPSKHILSHCQILGRIHALLGREGVALLAE